MRRIFLLISLILAITLSAGAQIHHKPSPRKLAKQQYVPAPKPHPSPHVSYYDGIGEFRLHITGDLGINDLEGLFWHEYPCHYSIGGMAEIQTGRLLSLGLGAEYYGTLCNNPHNANDDYYNCVPVYGNVRLSTPGYSAKFFVEARAGYAIPLNTVSTYKAEGLFTGAGIGFSIYGNNFSVGINVIDITNGSSDLPDRATDFYLRYSYAISLY